MLFALPVGTWVHSVGMAGHLDGRLHRIRISTLRVDVLHFVRIFQQLLVSKRNKMFHLISDLTLLVILIPSLIENALIQLKHGNVKS